MRRAASIRAPTLKLIEDDAVEGFKTVECSIVSVPASAHVFNREPLNLQVVDEPRMTFICQQKVGGRECFEKLE